MGQTASFVLAALLAAACCLAVGTVNADTGSDLAKLSLEELMNIEITSASEKAERLSEAAAGRDLLNNQHMELTPHYVPAVGAEVQRSTYAGVTWRL